MPNWVLNKVSLQGSEKQLQKFNEFVKSKESNFDFNNIIPIPEAELQIAQGFLVKYNNNPIREFIDDNFDSAVYMYTLERNPNASETFCKAVLRLVKQYINQDFSAFSMEGLWIRKHWGTKWEASTAEYVDDTLYIFKTAWSTPVPIYEALGKRFPEIDIKVEFADEDIGSNCGIITIRGTSITYKNLEISKKGQRFATDLWGWDD